MVASRSLNQSQINNISDGTRVDVVGRRVPQFPLILSTAPQTDAIKRIAECSELKGISEKGHFLPIA